MDEYDKLVSEWTKRTGEYDKMPTMYDEEFICMIDDKFLYSNNQIYTYMMRY